MSKRERELHAVLAREDQVPFDSFSLFVAVFVCALLAVAGIPAFGRAPGQSSIVLLVVVAVICLLAAIQWLALMIRFGYQAPIPPVLIGVGGVLVAASVGGLRATLIVLALAVVLQYTWRIFAETGTRFADVALSVTALVLFGLLPAHILLVRRLPFGPDSFYLWLIPVFAFASAQALLGRPARDGTRGADLSTILSGVLAWLVGSVVGALLGDPFGFGAGILVGGLVALGCSLGQVVLELMTPAPVDEEGRRMRRRPILFDAIAPIIVSAPFGYYAIRHVLSG